MPDLAQQACVPAARRQALGAWTSPATAEIYTRTLRTGIVSVWRETVGELDQLDAAGGRWATTSLQEEPHDGTVAIEEPPVVATVITSTVPTSEPKRQRSLRNTAEGTLMVYNETSKKLHWAQLEGSRTITFCAAWSLCTVSVLKRVSAPPPGSTWCGACSSRQKPNISCATGSQPVTARNDLSDTNSDESHTGSSNSSQSSGSTSNTSSA